MRIAVDAMGGDYAPASIVAGAVDAARGGLPGLTGIVLVGDEVAVKAELAKHEPVPSMIEVRHASEIVGMGEHPALAIRKKKDSSISRCIDMVKSGECGAVVSAGNTGAVVVAASLKLRTLERVERSAIAVLLPTVKEPIVLIDAGANIDSPPKLLVQFAVMGSVYAREFLKRKDPVVGLMSIGEEDTKGNDFTKEVFEMLKASKLNFRGNVEGHDVFEGDTDVVVCDGFLGNVILKTSESAAKAVATMLKKELMANPLRKLAALFLSGAFKAIKCHMDPEVNGGALLLGVNGVCIITHGASSRRGIFHSIRVACESIQQNVNNLIIEEMKKHGF